MKVLCWLPPICLLGLLALNCTPYDYYGGGRNSWQQTRGSSARALLGTVTPPSQDGMRYTTLAGMTREVRLRPDLVPRGSHGRKVVRPMTPRLLTTPPPQNPTADRARAALALKRGPLRWPKSRRGNRIGYLIWHFTVDEGEAIQHLPVREQGEHADFDGPGNRLSIGIEMCENRGNDLQATIDRTAKLTAVLMTRNGIPLRNVVPHYHWPRRGKSPPNKNCPHFLLDNGRPGAKWRAFLNRVNYHYRRLHPPG